MITDEERLKQETGARLRDKYPDIFSGATTSLDESQRKPVKISRTCQDCKGEYEYTPRFIAGIKIDMDSGRCRECQAKFAEVEKNKLEKLKTAAIKSQKNTWWIQSGVPDGFLIKKFDDYDLRYNPDGENAYNRCVEYAERFPLNDYHYYPSLLIYSENSWGVGKTHLAASICRRILEKWDGQGATWDEETARLNCFRRNPIKFISEPDMFSSITATFNYSHEQKQILPTENQIMNQLISVPLLVLDDIGKQEVADMRFVQRTLFRIIDARWRTGLPMILTANLNPEGIKYHFGGGVDNDASYDRLREMVQGRFIRIDGKSYRINFKKGGENAK